MAFYSGLACRPADINLPFGVFLCPRDSNPGWGDWSRSFLWQESFCCFFLFDGGQVNVSAFACNATGLDAVQRLEQKKVSLIDEQCFGNTSHAMTYCHTVGALVPLEHGSHPHRQSAGPLLLLCLASQQHKAVKIAVGC